MALKLPGISERIRLLWLKRWAEEGKPSETSFAQKHGLPQQSFNTWVRPERPVQPDFKHLQAVAAVFGVRWEWIVIGKEGVEALRDYKPPDLTPRDRRSGAQPRRSEGAVQQ